MKNVNVNWFDCDKICSRLKSGKWIGMTKDVGLCVKMNLKTGPYSPVFTKPFKKCLVGIYYKTFLVV